MHGWKHGSMNGWSRDKLWGYRQCVGLIFHVTQLILHTVSDENNPAIRLSIHPFIQPSIYQSIHLSIHPSTCPFHLSIHACIHPSTNPSIYPSMYTSTYPFFHSPTIQQHLNHLPLTLPVLSSSVRRILPIAYRTCHGTADRSLCRPVCVLPHHRISTHEKKDHTL